VKNWTTARYLILGLIVLLLVVTGIYAWADRYSEIAAVKPLPTDAFDKAMIEKGASLVAIGDCAGCHTRPGGKSFAGGSEIKTPFGAIFSTNITPDVDSGIGAWSLAAFTRALREGVDRSGGYLYPAFPYEHFTKVTDGDIAAIYAYLMTRPPVSAPPVENKLRFPFNIRTLLAGWNLLFLRQGAYTPDPAQDDKWNRGAYLVEGLAHCGACHTPLNILGAERGGNARYAGETLEGWHAPALNADSPAPVPWTVDAMVNFLLDGWDGDHGIAAGTMTPVVNGLGSLTEDDAEAIATYILSFQDKTELAARTKAAKSFAEEVAFGASPRPPPPPDTSLGRGEATFTRVCANCHRAGTNTAPLALSSVVNGPDPRNLIHIIDQGIEPPRNSADRSMPAFRGSLSASNLADLVTFVRAHFSRKPAWSNVTTHIDEARAAEH
jgi:mono/diheme cytochrome c family protein